MRFSYDKLLYVVSFIAPLVLFLPVHPVVQGLIYNSFSSVYIALVLLFILSLVFFIVFPAISFKMSFQVLLIFTIILLYIFVLFISSIRNYEYHAETYNASMFSILITLPLAALMAYLSSLRPMASFVSLCVLGASVVFSVLLSIFSEGVSSSGFIGASIISGKANYQSTAAYVGMFFILLLHLFKSRICLFLIHSVAILILAMIGTRSALLAYILAVIFIYLIRNKSFFIKYIFLLTIVILFSVYLSSDIYKPVAFSRIAVLFDGSDSSSRIFLFSKALEMWTKSSTNFLVGGGLGSFPVYIGSPGVGWYPHNFILETLAEGGLLAFLFLFVLLFYYFNDLFKNLNKKSLNYLGLLSFYFLITYQFIGGVGTIWIPLFFVLLYLFTINAERVKSEI